ncbi:probable glutamate carboxypeptidase AMP1 isoform X2 [Alnus glutinosa]|uniref:probable glutamate carboxypeptidase AMP1 isoform X2 n=1 Tax=Alnus glutinosa TaxID=3517 RepID=UPI002D76F8FE|nr:probable glutamate carboxypeptidase AMP1 isoform X2 [Alnus glutinosa]
MAEAYYSKASTIFTSKPPPVFTFLLLLVLCILGFYTLHYPHPAPSLSNPEAALRYRQIFLSSATNGTLASYLRALTQHPHIAGTKASLDTVNYVLSKFMDLDLETRTANYTALLSYPVYSSLSAHFSNGTVVDIPLAELAESANVVRPYHAYSPSGSAHAKVVFVNHGTDKDYRALGKLGVNVSGCVVIARRGGLPRGVMVRKAETQGASAVLLYTEGDMFKKGFERGTVMSGVGDPLSPGWAGVDGGERLHSEDSEVLKRFPRIPSMPLSAEAAEFILGSLGGAQSPPGWPTGVGVGPGPTMLNFTYQGEKRVENIHNVFAVIRGLEEPDRYVLLGNHRDAWTYGAVDPNSGTAALLDIARRYALLMHLGWRPRRTIFLCSWDAEEFGMIQRLSGVDSDFAPFVQHAGVPSVDIYYGRDFPVYHTAFDSYSWMTNYGDPLFQRHVAVAGIWGLLALHLADDSIIPFNYVSYANQLQAYKGVLSKLDGSVSLYPLTRSIQELDSAAKEAEDEAKILRQQETTGDSVVLKKRALNDRLMLAERGFLDADGLQGRQWFKHLIYGPPSDYESKLVFFPGVADAISRSSRMSRKERQAAIEHEIWRAARAIERAAKALRGDLS